MILVDANLLLYARFESYPDHEASKRWLEERLNGRARVGLAWPSLLAFLRLATNPRWFPSPLAMEEAWDQVLEWLALPVTWTPTPTADHSAALEPLLRGTGVTPKLVMDAHLAALAIEHGLILCSADRDFARYAGVRWENPLAERRPTA